MREVLDIGTIFKTDKLQNIISEKIGGNIRSYWTKVAELASIRILYTLLAYFFLKDAWYVGYGSYGIEYCIWKDVLAFVLFFAITLLYATVSYKDAFVKCISEFLYVVYFIPLNASVGLNNLSVLYLIETSIYIALLLALIWRFSDRGTKEQNLTTDSVEIPRSVDIFCLAICILFIAYKLTYNGLQFSLSISGDNVYSVRADLQTYLDQISGSLYAYIISILRNLATVVTPFYLLVSLLKKKWVRSLVAVVAMLSLFAVTSGKGNLFFVIVVIALVVCEHWNLFSDFCKLFRIGVIAFLLLSVIECLVRGQSTLYTIFIRREMYIPAWLNSIYYDYFCQHAKVWWSQNTFLLQNLIQIGYTESPLSIISNVYFQGEVPSPNTGLFAEAYMHCGVLGIAIYPCLITVLVQFSSHAYKGWGNAINVLMCVALVLQLVNVPMLRTDFVLSYTLFTIAIYLLRYGREKGRKIRIRFNDCRNKLKS